MHQGDAKVLGYRQLRKARITKTSELAKNLPMRNQAALAVETNDPGRPGTVCLDGAAWTRTVPAMVARRRVLAVGDG